MAEPTEKEIIRGISLLRMTSEEKEWVGPAAVFPIDEVCKWIEGRKICGKPIQNALVLLCKNIEQLHVVALCEHHTACMEAAVEAWRSQN